MARTRLTLLALLAALTSARAQELVADQALEVELKASDPLLEGHGPSRTFEYDVTFDGTLHVWAASEDFDPILRITNADGELLAEDDDSGGGSTAYFALAVSRNELSIISVAAADAGATGKLVLHVSEAPEADAPDLTSYRALIDQSNSARGAGDYATARAKAAEVAAYLLARPAAEQGPAWLTLLNSAGHAANEAQDTHTAHAAWKRVYEVRLSALPDDHPDLQWARQYLAVTTRVLGDLAGARALEEKALEVRSRTLPDDHPHLQAARQNLALTMRGLGDPASARALEEKVLEVRSRTLPDEHTDLQAARLNLAATLSSFGDLAGARALEEKVLEVFSRTLPDDGRDLQAARLNLGLTIKALGDLAGARVLEEKALGVFSRTLPDDHPDLQAARTNLAATLDSLGDLAGARALEEKALEVSSRTLPDDHPDLQVARLSLAATLGSLGDLAGARSLEEKVLEVRLRTLPDDHRDLQAVRGNLANTLEHLGDRADARALRETVLEVFSRTLPDDHTDLQAARLNLAVTLGSLGDLPGARALEEKALEVSSRTLPDDHPDLQAARANLAGTIVSQIAHAARSSGGEGERTRDREEGQERCAELIGALCRAQARAARAAILASPTREAEERCSSLAKLLDHSLSFARGYGVFEPLRTLEVESFVLSETTRGAALVSADLTRRAADPAEYADLRGALRQASDALASLAQQGSTSEELDRALSRREALERELVALARPLSGGRESLLELDAEALAARLEGGEAAVSFRRFNKWQWEVLDELDSKGPPAVRRTSVASLCAFVVRGAKPDGARDASAPRLVDLGPLAPIEAAAGGWREAICVGLERGMAPAESEFDGVKQRGEELRELVFDPLLPALGGAHHVVVALDDVLHLVPLEALALADSEELVGDRWRIDTRATLTELLTDPPAAAGTALVALGGASFNVPPLALSADEVASTEEGKPVQVAALLRGGAWERGFAPLTHSADEARGVGALYAEIFEDARPSLVLEKRKASREALEELAPKARFVHIATHGWFAPESIRSWSDEGFLDEKTGLARMSGVEQVRGMSPMLLCGLALAGANLPENELGRAPGLVTADELSTLDLSNCELVVLSACDTNVGERRAGQGVASLQKALQMAGARSVITSLWKVPDEATKELMLDFYRRLWVEKKPKWQALWEAKLKLRNAKDERGEPLYTTRDWAAWVLTGDPR